MTKKRGGDTIQRMDVVVGDDVAVDDTVLGLPVQMPFDWQVEQSGPCFVLWATGRAFDRMGGDIQGEAAVDAAAAAEVQAGACS